MQLWATSLQGCVSCPGTVLLQRQLGRWVWNLETQHRRCRLVVMAAVWQGEMASAEPREGRGRGPVGPRHCSSWRCSGGGKHRGLQ